MNYNTDSDWFAPGRPRTMSVTVARQMENDRQREKKITKPRIDSGAAVDYDSGVQHVHGRER